MSALAGSAILTLIVSFVLSHGSAQLPSLGAGSSSPTAPVAAGSNAPLDPRIASLAARQPGTRVEAIVQFRAGVGVRRAQADSVRAGGHVGAALHVINALVVTMTARQARALAGNADVHSVSLNAQVTSEGGPQLGRRRGRLASQLQTTYDQTLGATDLWRSATGAGVGVAVIDTGIDGQLADFASASGASRVIATAVTNPGARTVFDTYGHGTDVAGIIAGNGNQRAASDPLRGQYVGVAPDANLVAIKASDDHGNATVLNVIYGLQFAIDHARDYNIRVVNLSLDSATPQSYKTDPLDAAVEAAWKHGIVVVAAAGNRGTTDNAVQFAPANDPYAITVGAVDENGTADPGDDAIAPWSSRGVTQDGVQKPDVYAPGAHIVSLLAPDSYFAHTCPNCVVGGQYIRTSGTSMAAPMVSGLIADVLSRHAGLTPDQVKGALTSSSVRSNPALQEVNAVKVALDLNPQPANQGLAPSKLLGADGNVNYTMGSWSMGSWSTAQGALKAPFAMGSWSCESCTKGSGAPAGVNSSMGSWSMGSWSTIQDEGGNQ
jgi:serine protease AprX